MEVSSLPFSNDGADKRQRGAVDRTGVEMEWCCIPLLSAASVIFRNCSGHPRTRHGRGRRNYRIWRFSRVADV